MIPSAQPSLTQTLQKTWNTTNTLKCPVRYLVISDVHLGHGKNPTANIIKNLKTWLKLYVDRDDIDILFVAGDLFDELLVFTSGEVAECMAFMAWLIEFCCEKDIRLRILEGTPSHDREQSKVFELLHSIQAKYVPVDLRYISTLSIEKFEEYGMSVLYVPDAWHPSTDETYNQVKQLLKDNHLDQVDIAIMHGSFAYQLPAAAVKVPKHNESDYLSIVKYFINIGHIHVHSVFERILAQGSFDRISHGEEDPKGGMEMVIHPNGEMEYYFIENKHAMVFKTVKLKQPDLEKSVEYIRRMTKSVPQGHHVRIVAEKTHPLILGFDEVRRQFPMFQLTKKTLDELEEDQYNLIAPVDLDEEHYIPVHLTRENLEERLLTQIRQHHDVPAHRLDLMSQLLRGVMT